jgi:hypothetical protein
MTKMAKAKLERITTPAGKALWPWLSSPDTKFKSEGIYKVDLVIPKGECLELCERLNEASKAAQAAAVKDAKTPLAKKSITVAEPYTDEVDESGEPTGNIVFKFKTNASFTGRDGQVVKVAPKAFDAAAKEIPMPNVYSGSRLRVSFSPFPYHNPATRQAGISLRLHGVQILDLVTGGRGDAASYGFGEVAGGYEYKEDVKSSTPSRAEDADALRGELVHLFAQIAELEGVADMDVYRNLLEELTGDGSTQLPNVSLEVLRQLLPMAKEQLTTAKANEVGPFTAEAGKG